jgi:hypothetical protein
MTSRLLLAGPVALHNGDEPQRVELWASPSTAVAFAGGTQVGVLTGLTLDLTADRRLRLSGFDPEGEAVSWEATDEERIVTRWPNARVQWQDGRGVWAGATVAGSQHGVTVTRGGDTATLPGARLQAVGSQRWIIDGETRVLASDGRGCGCGGRKRR